jgi:lipoate-protein ligase A
MQWSADTIFDPVFCGMNVETNHGKRKSTTKRRTGRQTLIFHGKSCGISGGVGETLVLPNEEADEFHATMTNLDETVFPTFQLRENDYVLGEKKMGGNAQSIVSSGFLHHTSFLWDYDHNNMEYLTLPEKRPEYRGNRSHNEFLIKLKDRYGSGSTKNSFFEHVKYATSQTFELENVLLSDVLDIANEQFGSLQHWFDSKCRTKIIKLE